MQVKLTQEDLDTLDEVPPRGLYTCPTGTVFR
jgi:hypothetical protein